MEDFLDVSKMTNELSPYTQQAEACVDSMIEILDSAEHKAACSLQRPISQRVQQRKASLMMYADIGRADVKGSQAPV
jgi:hypothetical protein